MKKALSVALGTAILLAYGSPSANGDWKDDIGYTALKNRIGAALEDGTGVVVAMSEAPSGGKYLPDPNDNEFQGKTILDKTGTNTGTNGHANNVAKIFFGNTSSIASGVSEIHGYEAGNWVIDTTGASSGTDPLVPSYKIINNSWVARPDVADPISESDAAVLLARVDFLVDHYDTIVVGATDNPGHQFPRLLAPSYNSITVGLSNGTHTSGITQNFYGPGRTKPDIVAPAGSTSSATPMVSSATALLYEKGMGTDAVRSETMRAVLLAGATKTGLTGWDRTTTRPLDEVFGAGQLNVDNSYSILEGGQFAGSASEPATTVGEDGWDYQLTFDSNGALYYDIEVADGMQMNDLSIILAWNLEVTDTDPTEVFNPSIDLANFDLRLYNSTDAFRGSMIDASLSIIDNVEHIYVDQLSAGRYTIEIMSDQSRDFAIAWSSSFSAVPEPGTGMIFVLAGIALVGRRRRRDT